MTRRPGAAKSFAYSFQTFSMTGKTDNLHWSADDEMTLTRIRGSVRLLKINTRQRCTEVLPEVYKCRTLTRTCSYKHKRVQSAQLQSQTHMVKSTMSSKWPFKTTTSFSVHKEHMQHSLTSVKSPALQK